MPLNLSEYEDDEDEFPNEDDMSLTLDCYSCGREFEVGFGEEPDSCPLCGQDYE